MKWSWRLISELDALIYSEDKCVVLISGQKKSEESKATVGVGKKWITPNKVALTSNEFDIRFAPDLSIQIQHEDFPDREWYTLKNIIYNSPSCSDDLKYRKYVYEIIDSCGLNPTGKFEAAFSDDFPGRVKLVSEDVGGEYESCFDEMTRRMNCSLYKKTKKWIPGHRYDNEHRTFFYLGCVSSRKGNSIESTFHSSSNMTEAHLVIEDIKGCNSISDVFKTRTFGNGENFITVIPKPLLMVDSGEAIKNDVSDISQLWDDMVDKAVADKVSFRYLMDIFTYQSPGNVVYSVSSHVKDIITEILKSELEKCSIRYWDNKKSTWNGSTLGQVSQSGMSDASLLWHLFSHDIAEDPNLKRSEFNHDLLQAMGIDVGNICSYVVDNFDPNRIRTDFEYYADNIELYLSKRGNLGVTMITRADKKADSLKSTFNDGALAAKLVSMCTNAISTFGKGIKNFYLVNRGSVRYPNFYYNIEISYRDIIDSYDSISDIPSDLKEDMMKNNFLSLQLFLRKDVPIE